MAQSRIRLRGWASRTSSRVWATMRCFSVSGKARDLTDSAEGTPIAIGLASVGVGCAPWLYPNLAGESNLLASPWRKLLLRCNSGFMSLQLQKPVFGLSAFIHKLKLD